MNVVIYNAIHMIGLYFLFYWMILKIYRTYYRLEAKSTTLIYIYSLIINQNLCIYNSPGLIHFRNQLNRSQYSLQI
ncbi:unnamed protein product [Paramecium sonneborni]|uniref:Uncharacterized protein n=1 Tax=Paramecium sonneborni TaxID=65129 RepID=A0A8S1QNH4_9CILI|nr:unnamed protein product [Paramecium sonneborni]